MQHCPEVASQTLECVAEGKAENRFPSGNRTHTSRAIRRRDKCDFGGRTSEEDVCICYIAEVDLKNIVHAISSDEELTSYSWDRVL